MTSPELIAEQAIGTDWRRFHGESISLVNPDQTEVVINVPNVDTSPPDPLVEFAGHKGLRILPFGGDSENRFFEMALVLVDRIGLPGGSVQYLSRLALRIATCTCGNVTGDAGGLVTNAEFFVNDITAVTLSNWMTDVETAYVSPGATGHDPADAAGRIAEIFVPDCGNAWGFFLWFEVANLNRQGNALYKLETRSG
jgi:hypothetical protein